MENYTLIVAWISTPNSKLPTFVLKSYFSCSSIKFLKYALIYSNWTNLSIQSHSSCLSYTGTDFLWTNSHINLKWVWWKHVMAVDHVSCGTILKWLSKIRAFLIIYYIHFYIFSFCYTLHKWHRNFDKIDNFCYFSFNKINTHTHTISLFIILFVRTIEFATHSKDP